MNGYMGAAYVRVVTRSSMQGLEPDYLVHSIVKTYDGFVTLQVWLGAVRKQVLDVAV